MPSLLYFHFPFCASRCIYCGFYSTTAIERQGAYVDAMLNELRLRWTEEWSGREVNTIYFGGGTPSTLPVALLDRLIQGIADICDISTVEEWTMECNPDDINDDMARWLAASPINRISMGAQTFDADRLRWLRRRHTPQQVRDAVTLLRRHGMTNISLDLMFGFPGQRAEDFAHDVQEVIALRPEHVSAYSLMYEEGTPLYRMLENGTVCDNDEEDYLCMYDTMIDLLADAGYEHYEISNFALPGYRSRHNSGYWQELPYLGIGAAAHSFSGRQRWWNISDLKRYIQFMETSANDDTQRSSFNSYKDSGNVCLLVTEDSEDIDSITRYNDIITTALRTCEGISLSSLPPHQQDYLLRQAAPHLSRGTLICKGGYLHLTRAGLYISDSIMTDLIMSET